VYWFWRLAETGFQKVRDGETPSPTRETRALPPSLVFAREEIIGEGAQDAGVFPKRFERGVRLPG
jgi:hypothetical protein